MRDPGLQQERTRLAWARTSGVAAVNAALMLRSGAVSDSVTLLAAGVLCTLLALVMLATGSLRARQLALTQPVAASSGLLAMITGCVVAAAGCVGLAHHGESWRFLFGGPVFLGLIP